MDIVDFLSLNDAVVNVRAPDKARLLKELCHRAAATLDLGSDHIADQILRREELGSTGVGGGVAIPHARVREIKKPFGMLARLSRPIDFGAIDGEPVDLVFLLLLPTEHAGEQLNALAAVARKLRNAETLEELRRAPDASALYRTMVATSAKSAAAAPVARS